MIISLLVNIMRYFSLLFFGLAIPIFSSEITQNQGEIIGGFTKVDQRIIVHRPDMMVIGIECRTSNDSGALRDIPKLWDTFYSEHVQEKIPNKLSEEVVALYCDYEGDHEAPYSLVIGCFVSSIDQIPEGMVSKRIPESTFAVFHVAGDFPKSLIDTWADVWDSNLERSYTGDYEIYGEKFSGDLKEMDVFVAIAKDTTPGLNEK